MFPPCRRTWNIPNPVEQMVAIQSSHPHHRDATESVFQTVLPERESATCLGFRVPLPQGAQDSPPNLGAVSPSLTGLPLRRSQLHSTGSSGGSTLPGLPPVGSSSSLAGFSFSTLSAPCGTRLPLAAVPRNSAALSMRTTVSHHLRSQAATEGRTTAQFKSPFHRGRRCACA